MLDFVVKQMSKVNREKGYYFRLIFSSQIVVSKNSCQPVILSQSDTRSKPIANQTPASSRAWHRWRVFALSSKGPGKRGHIVADTLLPTQMFPRLPARATFVADTNFVSGTQNIFQILFRNILCPQQMFPSLRSPRNVMGNIVSATMCPRLPGP